MLKNDENVVIEKAVKTTKKATKKDTAKADAPKKSTVKKAAKTDVAGKKTTGTAKESTDDAKKATSTKKATTGTVKKTAEKKAVTKKATEKKAASTEKSTDVKKSTKVSADKSADKKSAGDVKKAFKGKEAKSEGCKCTTDCGGCGCKSDVKKYGNVTLTCRADVLAKICGVPVSRLVQLFNMQGVKLKFITDFKSEFYDDDTDTLSDVEKDYVDEDLSASFESWLRLNAFKTPFELAEQLGNTTAKDISDAAKAMGITLNTYKPVDYTDLDFVLNMLSNMYSIYEVAEKLSTSVQKIKGYEEKKAKKQRHSFSKIIKVSGLTPATAVLTSLSCMSLQEIADTLGCSLSQANEFARKQGMRVVYVVGDKPKKATYKDLENLLDTMSTFDMLF